MTALEVGSDRTAARAREDYVKAIFQLGNGSAVKAADVARYLNVSPVSVSKARRSLERDGLLGAATGSSPRALQLSPKGRRLAVAMVRRHRLVETFLHRSLGVELENLHAEAERIEHVISDEIADRLAQFLEFPTCDPHGHDIPYRARDAPAERLSSLANVEPGTAVRVASLDDRDAGVVRRLRVRGVLPGLVATVRAVDAVAVSLRSAIGDVVLPIGEAATVRVRIE